MNAANESKITTRLLEDGPKEVQLLVNEEKAIITRHTAECSWEHLVHVTDIIKDEIYKEFLARQDELKLPRSVAYEPFTLILSFWRKGDILTKKKTSAAPRFETAHEETALSLLSKLPKMLWQLRKTHSSGKADTLMVAFEWLETVTSAPAKKVAELVAERMAEKG